MNPDFQKITAAGRSWPVAVYYLPCFFFLLLSVLLPVMLSADTGKQSLGEVREILRENRISPENSEEILAVCREAEGKEIPPNLLISRIQEGLAKGIPLSRLVPILENDVAGLLEARDLIMEIEGAEEFLHRHNLWQRTANLRAAGFSTRVIRRLIEMSITDSEVYQPVTGLFAALTQWGLSEIQGLRVVQSLVRSELSQDEYPQVTSLFTRARQVYLPPDEVIRRMESELPNVRNLKQLEGRILE